MTQPCTHEDLLDALDPTDGQDVTVAVARRPHLIVLPDVVADGEAGAPTVQPEAPTRPPQVDQERWAAAWEHRPLLLGLARQRVESHVAEDVVSEAMLRAATADEVREGALRPWLVTTTLRLCTDHHRRTQRERRRDLRLAAYEPAAAPAADEDVVDDLQAQWFAGQMERLPERQARALWLRAHGNDIAAIAVAMVLPYKSVESLLSRGRHSLRGWAGAVVAFFGGWRVIAKRKAQFHVAVATIAATGDLTFDVARAATGLVTKSF